jgi:ribonucleoside-triphosphate reductase
MKIFKRDGTEVEFDKQKIVNAIMKAAARCIEHPEDGGKVLAETISFEIETIIMNNIDFIRYDVEHIQDLVVKKLLSSNYNGIAEQYISYRAIREEQRNVYNNLDVQLEGIVNLTSEDTVANANKDAKVFNTQRDLVAGVVYRDFALRKILPQDVAEAHKKGELHYHDLDYSPFAGMYNCCLINFEGMLKDGFVLGNAHIESPKSLRTAVAVVAQIVANVSSNIYGGTTFNRIDEVLAEYAEMSYQKHLETGYDWVNLSEAAVLAYAEQMTLKEIFDCMQGLEYELNTLYNANGQTPFHTLGFGLGTTKWSKEIQKAILQVRIDGLGKDKQTAVFPKLVFARKKGINYYEHDPNYDVTVLALECASKRIYPDILNYEKVVEVTGSFKFPMSCRSFLSPYIDPITGGEEIEGRNNLGVVTLNLPRIALETESITDFTLKLLERLELCKKALLTRISTFEKVTAKNAPILYQYGAAGLRLNPNDPVAEHFKNGRASISLGYIGIYETVAKFYGKNWYDKPRAIAFSVGLIKTLRDSVDEWKKETGYGFSLYGSPSESLCHRLIKLDREQFGVIEGITDKEYYTNSFHVSPEYEISPIDKMKLEAEYIPYSSGGFISYVEMPNLQNNKKALLDLWNASYDITPYYAINTPVDQCFNCGFEGEFRADKEGFYCPICSNRDPNTCSCVRRVSGYISNPVQRPFNKGKLYETKRRVKHVGGLK